jgi:hypothetical protein
MAATVAFISAPFAAHATEPCNIAALGAIAPLCVGVARLGNRPAVVGFG